MNLQANFLVQDNIDIISSFNSITLIESHENSNRKQCLAMCTKQESCLMVILLAKVCNLYNQQAYYYLIENKKNIGNVFIKK